VSFCIATLTLLLSAPGLAQDDEEEGKAKLEVVDHALDQADLARAQRELEAAKALLPRELPAVHYFEGRLAFEEGKYEEALEHLRRAQLAEKPGSLLKLVADTLELTKAHAKKESAHFIFSYPPGKDELLAPYALETLEAQRALLESAVGWAPEGKIRVEVINDADELARVSTLTLKEINTTNTIAICKFNKLIITSPKAVVSGYDWQDTLAHELTHFFVTGKGRNTVPIWLQEGLAKHFESAWRGAAGEAVSPSQKAFLAARVREGRLVTFEKMHPSIAMLPNWEDAYTAMAEVDYAITYILKKKGPTSLATLISRMRDGLSDQEAVGETMGQSFAQFEAGFLSYIKAQPFPKELIPPSGEKLVLKERGEEAEKSNGQQKPKDEISFQDFLEVTEPKPRQFAHLGELFRERRRMGAAMEELSKAHDLVGDKYESISNKYALSLMALRRNDEAEAVLLGSLKMHPGSAQTESHLGRVYLARGEFARAKTAFLAALAVDPFDPLTHLSLVRIADGLGDKVLGERARHASMVLMHATLDQVNHAAHML
jgi:tetratricopeptide (TPR) repeat protein